ncbi:SMI1/KNR4 family protein [Sphingobium sp. BHU LFT2]|uniref:SMI1/KNR4 family protein n=1 Tax=Sphingobium sp. BHU LFT2 TaxID=2807634 RepID=UPI001BEB2569|nr:SMI1/KNR4 family protein [Sphingobium sp. BHU LFT2]MBT2246854.1 SMI1/KNR4 family protein [Sphingobium sp. BHU LFT2]
MTNHRETSSIQQTVQFSVSTEACDTEELFRRVLGDRNIEDESTSNWRRPPSPVDARREQKHLKQPVTRVEVGNIFTWHLNEHTVIGPETDPKLIKQRVWQRRVGVKESGRLTEAQIAEQEKRLGIRLPMPWRDVYKHFNGGWVDTLYWGDMTTLRVIISCPFLKQAINV